MSSEWDAKLPGEDEPTSTRSVTGREPSALDVFRAGEEDREGELMKEAAGLVDALKPALPREKALAVAATALELKEEPEPWLKLAERTGHTMPLRLLHGGHAGVTGRADAERAVGEREKRAEAARAWIASAEGLPLPSASLGRREPLLVVECEEKQSWWLPGGIVGLVVAAGGTGKTTWLAELAMRVAFGDTRNPAHGVPYKVEKNGPVMVLLAEEDEQGVYAVLNRGLDRAIVGGDPRPTEDEWQSKVWALGGAEHATALGSLVMVDDPVRGRVTEVVPSALHDALCKRAREMGPLLVVLDPINQLLPAGASENDATSAAAMITLAGELRRAAEEGVRERWKEERTGRDPEDYNGPRPVVLLAHHEKKGAGDGGADAARGSTAFVDNARWVCRMTVDRKLNPALARWELVKTNYTGHHEHKAVSEWDDGAVVWRKVTEADKAAWDRLTGEVDARRTREGLLKALEEVGAEGITRSDAKSAHGLATVREAEADGSVVAVKKGGGQRLVLAKFAPDATEGETDDWMRAVK